MLGLKEQQVSDGFMEQLDAINTLFAASWSFLRSACIMNSKVLEAPVRPSRGASFESFESFESCQA